CRKTGQRTAWPAFREMRGWLRDRARRNRSRRCARRERRGGRGLPTDIRADEAYWRARWCHREDPARRVERDWAGLLPRVLAQGGLPKGGGAFPDRKAHEGWSAEDCSSGRGLPLH